MKRKTKRRLKKKRVRKYLQQIAKCICLNEKFEGSNAHHLNSNIIIYLPIELHQHISHSMRSGKGMAVMNLLAMQFLFGSLGSK